MIFDRSIGVPSTIALPRLDEVVGERELHEVAVQAGRQVRRVGVPVEDVERRRVLAQQVVVDPVVPDQVVGTQPREHAGQRAPVEVALALGLRERRRRRRAVDERPGGPGVLVVEHADAERQPGDAVEVARGRQVPDRAARGDAARAQPEHVRALGVGDRLDRVERLDHGARVVVEAPRRRGARPGCATTSRSTCCPSRRSTRSCCARARCRRCRTC